MSFQPGFDAEEALALMAICFSVNSNPTGVPEGVHKTPMPFPDPPPPGHFGWSLAYDPGKVVFEDNYWQLWKKEDDDGLYALCFRGTTADPSSIWDDLRVRMRGASVEIRGQKVPLALHPMARVHTGFSDALAAMLEDDVLDVLGRFADEGMTRLYVIGHSQGAAIATLCMSFLSYQDVDARLREVDTKAYLYAQPKPGNLHYFYDFQLVTAGTHPHTGTAYRLTSDQDWVPQVPLSIELPSDLSSPNPTTIPTPFHSRLLHWLLKLLKGPKWRQSYASAGIPVILRAKPGGNPQSPDDFLWQHHGQHYYELIRTQFGIE